MERFIELKTESVRVKYRLIADLLFRNRIVLDIWSILETMGLSVGDLKRFDVPKKKGDILLICPKR